MNKIILDIFMFLVFEDICGFLLSCQEWPLEELIHSINFFLLRPELHIAMQVKGIWVVCKWAEIDVIVDRLPAFEESQFDASGDVFLCWG